MRHGLNGIHNFNISRAAAEIAGNRLFDFVAARFGMFVQKGFGRHDKTLRAEAALRTAVLRERALQRMQPAVAFQAFDCGDFVADGFQRQRETREFGAAIDMHRAAAAGAHVAAAFGAGEIQRLANHVEQHVIRANRDFVGGAVDVEGNKFFVGHGDQQLEIMQFMDSRASISQK